MKKMTITFLAVVWFASSVNAQDGKKVFETYCWGCHHQTAVAFGPPFSEIASKRDAATIRAMITDPESVSKVLGYSRNAMPAFQLKEDELKSITAYILSYKENNTTKGKK
jgi:mono/diheme cytochrome c family protein